MIRCWLVEQMNSGVALLYLPGPAVCRVLIMSTERPQITHSRCQTDRFESPHYCTRESRRHTAKRSDATRKLLDEIHYLFIYLFQAARPIYRTVKQ